MLAKLANEPYSKGGPITDRLIERGFLTEKNGYHYMTPLGRRVKAAEFSRRRGFGDLVTKFWGQNLA